MAMRQYIGARYVPRFLGIYDPTQEYEALDVVENGSGTSYIARKIVPAGTSLTDAEYWFVYGASSGAIINLQNQIDIINNTDLPTIDSRLDDVERYTTNRKIIIIGDSYANRTNSGGKTISDILTDHGWAIVHTEGVDGGGFDPQNSTKRFANYLNGYSGDADEVTDVLFGCGVNDRYSSYADLITNITATLASAKALYKNAKMHIVPWGVSFYSLSGAANLLSYIPKAYEMGAEANNADCPINAQYMLRNTDLLDVDLVHPNPAGVDYIAGKLNTYLKTGIIDVYHYIETTLTGTGTGITYHEIQKMLMKRHNNNITIMTPGIPWGFFRIAYASTAPGVLGNIFTMDKTLFSVPSDLDQYWIPIRALCPQAGGVNFGGTAKLHFSGFDLKVGVWADNYANTEGCWVFDNTMTFND